MTLQLLDSVAIDHPGSGTRTLSLYQGDITALTAAEAVSYICISALPGDYSPTGGSVIGALAAKGVSVQQLSTDKAANYEPTMPCWISQDVANAGLNFSRIILFEPASPATQAGWDIGNIFRAVSCFQGTNPASIALPMVCTGSGGADLSVIFRQLFFDGAHWGSRNNWNLSEIKLIAYSQAQATAAKVQFATMKAQYLNPPYAQTGATPPAGMTQRQCNCVRAYTGNAYSPINGSLRANSLTNANYINLVATIEAISSGLENMADYTGLALRGTSLPDSVIADYKVEATITHFSYSSSSWDRPWGGSCLLKITSVTGTNVSGISSFPAEDEILFDKRMTDLVTAVQGAGTAYNHNYQHIFSSNETIPNYCGS